MELDASISLVGRFLFNLASVHTYTHSQNVIAGCCYCCCWFLLGWFIIHFVLILGYLIGAGWWLIGRKRNKSLSKFMHAFDWYVFRLEMRSIRHRDEVKKWFDFSIISLKVCACVWCENWFQNGMIGVRLRNFVGLLIRSFCPVRASKFQLQPCLWNVGNSDEMLIDHQMHCALFFSVDDIVRSSSFICELTIVVSFYMWLSLSHNH